MKYGDSPWFTINFFGDTLQTNHHPFDTKKPHRQACQASHLAALRKKNCDGLDFQEMILLLICEHWPIMIPQKARWFQGFFCLRTWWATGWIGTDWNNPLLFSTISGTQKNCTLQCDMANPSHEKEASRPRGGTGVSQLSELCRPILRSYLSALDTNRQRWFSCGV